MTEYDLAVIGAGPAGAAAAWRAARAGLRVALFERDALPRDKVCGEYLSAEAGRLLAALAPELYAAAPRMTHAAFVAPSGRRAEFALPRLALGVARWQLDAALAQTAAVAGCELRLRHGVRSVRPLVEGVEIGGEILSVGRPFALRARALIVAAGRWWSIAGLRAAAPNGETTAWIGVKAHLRRRTTPAASRAIEMYYFRGGYCGFAPLAEGEENACCLLHPHRARDLKASADFGAWLSKAAGAPALARRLARASQSTPTVATAPVHLRAAPACLGPVLFAGDAAGFLDPFTGDGMARALLGGALAGAAVAAALAAGEPLPAAAARYAAAIATASRRPFRWAAALRRLVLAPAWVQASAGALLTLAPIAQRAVAATRWQSRVE